MAVRDFGFDERRAWSEGRAQETDLETIATLFPDCEEVRIATGDLNRLGIDYIARLSSQVEIFIDAKNRDRGCSRFWRNRADIPDGEPDLALERWSVIPTAGRPGRIGWTLDPAKWTEYVLFKFDRADHDKCYLVPFQLLRMAMHRWGEEWQRRFGGLKYQHTPQGNYYSACVFVPVSVVWKAIVILSARTVGL
jgi:hypothetical protein